MILRIRSFHFKIVVLVFICESLTFTLRVYLCALFLVLRQIVRHIHFPFQRYVFRVCCLPVVIEPELELAFGLFAANLDILDTCLLRVSDAILFIRVL